MHVGKYAPSSVTTVACVYVAVACASVCKFTAWLAARAVAARMISACWCFVGAVAVAVVVVVTLAVVAFVIAITVGGLRAVVAVAIASTIVTAATFS